jgi:hypothetical protein
MKAASIATLAVAAEAISVLNMQSTLTSKIKMGGAVINSYCESDLQVRLPAIIHTEH